MPPKFRFFLFWLVHVCVAHNEILVHREKNTGNVKVSWTGTFSNGTAPVVTVQPQDDDSLLMPLWIVAGAAVLGVALAWHFEDKVSPPMRYSIQGA